MISSLRGYSLCAETTFGFNMIHKNIRYFNVYIWNLDKWY